ncbi:class I SAM-dependent methyltransferase [Aeromicrobium sp. Leaf350]|uniref:class I SAM-dependent methyltransferase n=1 Tax=Aeromicrobium sp. Leaf350 TaxID=2876565 RepID=UPI001E613B52|nr:class I SAM-dependent methyltransferase [Aeromicrobium sp. Leaf350]
MLDQLKKRVREKLVHVVEDAVRRQNEELHRQVRELNEQVAGLELRDRRDMFAAAEREAVTSSAAYVGQHFSGATWHPHPHETLRAALAAAPTGGMALEFGVFSGTTLRIIARERRGEVYGFDVFSGLPEDWRPGFPAGTFEVEDLPKVACAELVVGLFEDTLPGFLAEHDGPIDLLHVDCDLYSGAVTVLELAGDRLRPGSIVIFDEYLNHQNWQQGEFKAWAEHVARTGISYEYVAYTFDHEQVVVRVTDVPSNPA